MRRNRDRVRLCVCVLGGVRCLGTAAYSRFVGTSLYLWIFVYVACSFRRQTDTHAHSERVCVSFITSRVHASILITAATVRRHVPRRVCAISRLLKHHHHTLRNAPPKLVALMMINWEPVRLSQLDLDLAMVSNVQPWVWVPPHWWSLSGNFKYDPTAADTPKTRATRMHVIWRTRQPSRCFGQCACV